MALRRAYEDAFHQLSRQVGLLQSFASQPTPDGTVIEEAKRGVEQAYLAYHERRDLLARFMLYGDVKGAAATNQRAQTETAAAGNKPQNGGRNLDQRSRVERLAYQLWEEAGRPVGLAEEHWHRAERLIHNAV